MQESVKTVRTRRDVGKPECQKDPIFLFQRKSGKHWETEWVFFTREEGEEWGRDHAYNYPRGWRVFCVSALGELADVLRMPEQPVVQIPVAAAYSYGDALE